MASKRLFDCSDSESDVVEDSDTDTEETVDEPVGNGSVKSVRL